MSNSRKEALTLALRKNHGRRILEKLRNEIIEKTNITEITLTSLEKRDILDENFGLVYNEASRYVFKLENQENNLKIKKIFIRVGMSIEAFIGYMFLSHFDNIGAFEFNTKSLFENASELLEIDGDMIYFISEDLENGILIDFYESDIGPGYTYVLEVFGCKWPKEFESFRLDQLCSLNRLVCFRRPDNDAAGKKAAVVLQTFLQSSIKTEEKVFTITDHLPVEWDLADEADFDVRELLG